MIETPTTCPSCSSTLVKKNSQLFCLSKACPDQNRAKLGNFTKVLGIKGIGPKVIEKLDIDTFSELYSLSVEDLKQRLSSEKLAVKIYNEIQQSKNSDLSLVLQALGIPLIGKVAAQDVASNTESIFTIDRNVCSKAGLGTKQTESLLTYLETESNELLKLPLLYKGVAPKIKNEKLLSVCISGKLKAFKTKAEAAESLRTAGFNVVDSVTKNTSFLIQEDGAKGSKYEKALAYNIPIITNLLEFIKEHGTN